MGWALAGGWEEAKEESKKDTNAHYTMVVIHSLLLVPPIFTLVFKCLALLAILCSVKIRASSIKRKLSSSRSLPGSADAPRDTVRHAEQEAEGDDMTERWSLHSSDGSWDSWSDGDGAGKAPGKAPGGGGAAEKPAARAAAQQVHARRRSVAAAAGMTARKRRATVAEGLAGFAALRRGSALALEGRQQQQGGQQGGQQQRQQKPPQRRHSALVTGVGGNARRHSTRVKIDADLRRRVQKKKNTTSNKRLWAALRSAARDRGKISQVRAAKMNNLNAGLAGSADKPRRRASASARSKPSSLRRHSTKPRMTATLEEALASAPGPQQGQMRTERRKSTLSGSRRPSALVSSGRASHRETAAAAAAAGTIGTGRRNGGSLRRMATFRVRDAPGDDGGDNDDAGGDTSTQQEQGDSNALGRRTTGRKKKGAKRKKKGASKRKTSKKSRRRRMEEIEKSAQLRRGSTERLREILSRRATVLGDDEQPKPRRRKRRRVGSALKGDSELSDKMKGRIKRAKERRERRRKMQREEQQQLLLQEAQHRLHSDAVMAGSRASLASITEMLPPHAIQPDIGGQE